MIPDARIRSLLAVAAALGTRNDQILRGALTLAARQGAHDEIEEILIASLFVLGFPAALAAMDVWNQEPLRQQGERPEQPAGPSAQEKGSEIFLAVYGSQNDALRRKFRDFHPAVEDLVVRVGYGEMMSRPGVDLPTREVCLVAMLTSWKAWPQLHSHLRGALLVGVDVAVIEIAIEEGLRAATRADPGEDSAPHVREIWYAVHERWKAKAKPDVKTGSSPA